MEFDVKITPGILYDYMLHHTYTGATGLVGNCMGALMVVLFFYNGNVLALIGGLVVLAYTPWSLFLKSRQQMLRTPAFKNPIHYVLGDEGIQISQGEDQVEVAWDMLYKAVGTRKSIVIYTSKVNACIFPRKDLGGQTTEAIAIISANMPPAKVKIRF
ncbi:MAG: YcxB family protein [Lachnospiraceae bacterium]|jgi:hypothetical protein|nr:YcxB family protein [Lachnospiraceae bacterium]